MKKVIRKFLSSVTAAALMVPSTIGMINANATGTSRDPNGDGVVNIADAVFIKQYLAGAFVLDNITPLDVDDNGIVSYVDAELLQSLDAGVNVNLPNASPNDPINADEPYDSDYYKHNCYSSSATSYTTYTLESESFNNYGISPLSIIDENDFERSYDTAVVRIRNRANNNLIGSGFIVGDHKIATTARNVYNYYTGEFKDLKIEIVNSNNIVVATYYPHYIHIPEAYTTGHQMVYNYAMLEFNSNLSSYGKFELGVALDSYIHGGNVTAAGFPGVAVLGNGTESWRTQATGIITERDYPMRFRHTADTMFGTDGGPVYALDSWPKVNALVSGNVVIGIQSYSMGSYNEATAITSEVLKFYNSNN